MGKFSFSIPGRRKPPPQVPASQPMSKAHKILGSTPLNIDAHTPWDDTASSIVSYEKPDPNGAGYGDSDVDDDVAGPEHHVRIAKSEPDWADELNSIPEYRASSTTGSETEAATTETSSDLRKSQSTSTIKSWYDRANQPLSVSQQTSASAMARGLPSKAHKMLDMDNAHGHSNSKRKPARLDLSSLVSSRASRRHDSDAPATSADIYTKSPSILSHLTPTYERHRESRKITRRRTKESLRSPESGPETPRPNTGGSSRFANESFGNGLPTLYDHYEQMSLRHVMKQDMQPDASPVETVAESETEVQFDEVDMRWPPNSVPETPRTAFLNKPERSFSPTDCSNSADSISSRHTRTSKASKHTDRSFQEADLQEKSVLLLSSSDSEDEPSGEPLTKSPASAPMRRPSNVEDEVSSLQSSGRPKTSRTSRSAEQRAKRSSKRASFALANTYYTIPNTQDDENATPADSRAGTPFGQEISPSVRVSLMSNLSTNSATVSQGRSGYDIREARVVTMLPARRPSQVPSDQDAEAELDTGNSLATLRRESVNNSADQLTPPLSPSSVDFYIRSGHSSIDGPGSHNRFMAVSRQEEMLLSALRHKHNSQSRRSSAVSDSNHQSNARGRHSHEQQASQEFEEADSEITFDFDFPAPPSFNHKRMSSLGGSPSNAGRVSATTKSGHFSQGYADGSSMSPPTYTDRSPRKGILKGTGCETLAEEDEHEDILLYLDDAEPSPDLSDFKDLGLHQRFSDLAGFGSGELLSTTWSGCEDGTTNERRGSDSIKSHDYETPHVRGDSAATVRAGELEAGSDGMPRPDSPISPDSFPAVPPARTTLSNMARLSAVGPSRLGGEPGWWGDDD